jgi:hypothetical protein
MKGFCCFKHNWENLIWNSMTKCMDSWQNLVETLLFLELKDGIVINNISCEQHIFHSNGGDNGLAHDVDLMEKVDVNIGYNFSCTFNVQNDHLFPKWLLFYSPIGYVTHFFSIKFPTVGSYSDDLNVTILVMEMVTTLHCIAGAITSGILHASSSSSIASCHQTVWLQKGLVVREDASQRRAGKFSTSSHLTVQMIM